MAKSPVISRPAALDADWFLPAIVAEGTVGDCLTAVQQELNSRAAFIAAVRTALVATGATVDQVTELGIKARALETTLRFRLGVLRPERPQAWFRAPALTSTGPFQSTLLEEPVFATYDAHDAARVRLTLTEAWRERRCDQLPFRDSAGCLWATLLGYSAKLEQIVRLPEPWGGLRLDALPDGLTPVLESRSLRAFLLNVRHEILATRERLDSCYAELLVTSDKLWSAQVEELRRNQKAHQAHQQHQAQQKQQQKGASGSAHSSSTAKGGDKSQKTAEQWRDSLKKRRHGQLMRSFLTPADMNALKFMGFDDLPSPDSLRQRYLIMAKRLHPDRLGGSDHAFKVLTSAYSHLSGRVMTA